MTASGYEISFWGDEDVLSSGRGETARWQCSRWKFTLASSQHHSRVAAKIRKVNLNNYLKIAEQKSYNCCYNFQIHKIHHKNTKNVNFMVHDYLNEAAIKRGITLYMSSSRDVNFECNPHLDSG